MPLGEEAKDLGFRGLSVVIIFLTSVVIILIPVRLDPCFLQFFVPLCVYLMETKGLVRCFWRWEDGESKKECFVFELCNGQ